MLLVRSSQQVGLWPAVAGPTRQDEGRDPLSGGKLSPTNSNPEFVNRTRLAVHASPLPKKEPAFGAFSPVFPSSSATSLHEILPENHATLFSIFHLVTRPLGHRRYRIATPSPRPFCIPIHDRPTRNSEWMRRLHHPSASLAPELPRDQLPQGLQPLQPELPRRRSRPPSPGPLARLPLLLKRPPLHSLVLQLPGHRSNVRRVPMITIRMRARQRLSANARSPPRESLPKSREAPAGPRRMSNQSHNRWLYLSQRDLRGADQLRRLPWNL